MNILFYVTGSAMAAMTPMSLLAISTFRPADRVHVVLSRAAGKFVTGTACSLYAERLTMDDWDAMQNGEHVELARWPDVIVVYPATLNFVTRLAAGLADTPVMQAIQCSTAPTIVAPGLPPGGAESYAFEQARKRLTEQHRITLMPTVSAPSAALKMDMPGAPAPIGEVLELLDGISRTI
ncbi:flavoprotein [Nocardia fluminea]|uniref:flavoprotein n=1 Tax=Nocardia fluminea TaxID=134984 RepID=UPI0033DD7968